MNYDQLQLMRHKHKRERTGDTVHFPSSRPLKGDILLYYIKKRSVWVSEVIANSKVF